MPSDPDKPPRPEDEITMALAASAKTRKPAKKKGRKKAKKRRK